MKQFFKSLLGGVLFVAGVLLGLFYQAKVLDKPDTVINNDYGKVKTKGEGNKTQTESQSTVINDNKKQKRKFRLFGRKNKKT